MKDQMIHAEAVSVIAELREQVAALTKERDSLTHTLEHMEHTRDVEQTRHRETSAAIREQLTALAEQNEKYRKLLPHCNTGSYGYAIQTLYMECVQLPDLATPVLNKYRVEGMRMAAEICEHISDEYREREGRRYPELKTDAETGASDCESSIRTRAAELEKTNG